MYPLFRTSLASAFSIAYCAAFTWFTRFVHDPCKATRRRPLTGRRPPTLSLARAQNHLGLAPLALLHNPSEHGLREGRTTFFAARREEETR